MRQVLEALSIASAFAACSDESVVALGIIGPSPRINAPSTADVGASFDVSISTVGDGCYSFDSTQVVIEGNDTIILPYDRHLTGDCTHILLTFTHDVALRFDDTGDKSIVVRGLRAMDANEVIDVPLTVAVR